MSKVDPLEFQRDGFALVSHVFTAEEVALMRASGERFAQAALSRGHVLERKTGEIVPVGDLLGREGIDVVFDDRLLSIARAFLGARELVYFGDSGLMVGGALRGFHKDNTCRDDATHPDWQTPYTMLRMGIYLEDHARYSGGVKVRRGSHLHADLSSGAIVDVPATSGDVVVWNLRTTHSGHFVRVRSLPWLHLQPRFEIRLPQPLVIAEPCTRVALFVTYGLDDVHLAGYIKKHTDLHSYPDNYLYKSWLYSSPDPRFEEIARSRGCKLLRPIPDWGIAHGSGEKTRLGYVPTRPAPPDVYPPHGLERAIQTLGKFARTIGASGTLGPRSGGA